MLNVSPLHRAYETLPNLNNIEIPALAPMPTGETEQTRRVVERFGDDILAAGVHVGGQVVYVKPAGAAESGALPQGRPRHALRDAQRRDGH